MDILTRIYDALVPDAGAKVDRGDPCDREHEVLFAGDINNDGAEDAVYRDTKFDKCTSRTDKEIVSEWTSATLSFFCDDEGHSHHSYLEPKPFTKPGIRHDFYAAGGYKFYNRDRSQYLTAEDFVKAGDGTVHQISRFNVVFDPNFTSFRVTALMNDKSEYGLAELRLANQNGDEVSAEVVNLLTGCCVHANKSENCINDLACAIANDSASPTERNIAATITNISEDTKPLRDEFDGALRQWGSLDKISSVAKNVKPTGIKIAELEAAFLAKTLESEVSSRLEELPLSDELLKRISKSAIEYLGYDQQKLTGLSRSYYELANMVASSGR